MAHNDLVIEKDVKRSVDWFGHQMCKKIKQMSWDEKRCLNNELRNFTKTNCWWLSYHIAPILREVLSTQRHILFKKFD